MNVEYLREILNYNWKTGIFRWAKPRPKIRVGAVAGHKHHKGHIEIEIDGRSYMAHRLAWLYIYSQWPRHQIDHKNLNRSDNRIKNLREATNGQNCANRRAFGRSGLKGASLHKNWKWHASITHNKKCISLGYYDTAEEAHAVYVAKAKELHGEFARAK